ncbi:DUF1285 domain-containing protein [Psychrobacter sp. FDAARGOS_221]|uniref:DUF1285 domain-containing protein n=1 Tax=Psychrobacter sp. FDAARGOS_221 TaxID=1975705 RepID=UPI000BB532C1|nr:DUF1285 domain-containing protein [Psychrobacter sp. FDAARGOS_221]PNK60475.1 DUF1285 domain-containing protein [Psychrobacter sp. FDAARGOS_221]
MSNTDVKQTNPRGLETLSEHIEQQARLPTGNVSGRSLPPVDKWQPEVEADMDLLIKANGEWWHEGDQITRQSLVDLFSTVLWREGTDEAPEYFLKTPVEKLRIQVEDVPFLITQVNEVEQQGVEYLQFITSTGDVVYLTEDNPLEMRLYQQQVNKDSQDYRPYIEVRFGMRALISRNVLMHLVRLGELSEHQGETRLTLTSGGKQFTLAVPS